MGPLQVATCCIPQVKGAAMNVLLDVFVDEWGYANHGCPARIIASHCKGPN